MRELMSNKILDNNINDESTDIAAKRSRVIPTHNKWKSLHVNIFAYMLIGMLLFFGTCAGAQSAGLWSTSGRVTITGENVTATGKDPAEIRGFMTVKEVLNAYNVTWDEFSRQFNIPADTPLDSPLNTLEKVAPGFSVTSLRTWLTQRTQK